MNMEENEKVNCLREVGRETKVMDEPGGQITAWPQVQAHLATDFGLPGKHYVGNGCLCVSITTASLEPSTWLYTWCQSCASKQPPAMLRQL